MLHMLATLVTLIVLFGAGGVVASSLAEHRGAIAAALGLSVATAALPATRRRTRVRWSKVRMGTARAAARYAA